MINLSSALLALLLGLRTAASTDSAVPAEPVAEIEAFLEKGDLDRAIRAETFLASDRRR